MLKYLKILLNIKLMNLEKSIELYLKLLLEESLPIKDFVKNTIQYDTFLSFSDFNKSCMIQMFKYNTITRQEYFQLIPELEKECKKCWKFYLNPRNKSIKKYDVLYGHKYENAFINFLNGIGIKSSKGDRQDKLLPDNLILDKKDNIIAYYEVKYHNAPFVWAFKFNKNRECYEGSITIDYEKAKKQIQRIEKDIRVPVYYLHWIDFPCIKGVFFMSLEDTKKIIDAGVTYNRKEKEGDYITRNDKIKKVGYQEKFYPSLFEMKNFKEFINLFLH